ncbi:MAG: acyl carrier protein [Candidatus Omnitrophica bacterium]|nr:acyl carrier protein [Candidatus Omnitrophota bacterium]
MNADQIRTQLNLIFRDVFDDDSIQVHDQMTARDVDNWDSLTHINLIVASEKKFGVSFSTKDIVRLKNVGDFIQLIQKSLP